LTSVRFAVYDELHEHVKNFARKAGVPPSAVYPILAEDAIYNWPDGDIIRLLQEASPRLGFQKYHVILWQEPQEKEA
jgi:hypothetical protein